MAGGTLLVKAASVSPIMKSKLLSLVLVIAVTGAIGCTTINRSTVWEIGTTTIRLSGTAGSPFTDYYVQKGQRIGITNTLPFSLTEKGLSEVAIRKANPSETVSMVAQYENDGIYCHLATAAGPGVPGLRVLVHDGVAVEMIKR
jgi:hypothetical protein